MGGDGGWWCTLDYSISSGPFMNFKIEIGDGPGPGPELDNITIFHARNLNKFSHEIQICV